MNCGSTFVVYGLGIEADATGNQKKHQVNNPHEGIGYVSEIRYEINNNVVCGLPANLQIW